jgi:hypothetical protein
VTYRVEFHPSALVQLKGLPKSAFDDLVQRVVRLVDQPWDAVMLYPDEPEFRQAVFGAAGLLSFHVETTTETIRIFDVTWAG